MKFSWKVPISGKAAKCRSNLIVSTIIPYAWRHQAIAPVTTKASQPGVGVATTHWNTLSRNDYIFTPHFITCRPLSFWKLAEERLRHALMAPMGPENCCLSNGRLLYSASHWYVFRWHRELHIYVTLDQWNRVIWLIRAYEISFVCQRMSFRAI